MNSYGSTAAAPLIANIGRRVGMDYGINGSSADTEDLVEDVFAEYGISCSYQNYNSNVELMKTSLLNGVPVILRARPEGSSTGHAFIADRYKRTRTVRVNVYEWVYDNLTPPYTPVPAAPPYVEYIYHSPVISMIGMNWGWSSSFYNNYGWFSLTGDWIIDPYNFNTSRHMICNFSMSNND